MNIVSRLKDSLEYEYNLSYSERKELLEEIEKLNAMLNQADNKNLELIEKINKIYDIIENENITSIEARLEIQGILDKGAD